MRARSAWVSLAFSAILFAQAEKPSDSTKIFGPPPPSKVDKNKVRTVSGVVRDADGSLVPGAVVYLKDLKSGKQRSTIVGPNATFFFDELNRSYDYELRATRDKKSSRARLLSTFDTRLKPSMNLTLEAAEAAGAEKPEATEKK